MSHHEIQVLEQVSQSRQPPWQGVLPQGRDHNCSIVGLFQSGHWSALVKRKGVPVPEKILGTVTLWREPGGLFFTYKWGFPMQAANWSFHS